MRSKLIENPKLRASVLQRLSLSFTFTALVFIFPAFYFPFISVDFYGSHSEATIWGTVQGLLDQGSVFLGLIVFLASICIPVFKIVVMLFISFESERFLKLKQRLRESIDVIGKWSMLDVFLLAIMVAIFKLGPYTHAVPKMGAIFFALVVVFTLLATQLLNAQAVIGQNKEL